MEYMALVMFAAVCAVLMLGYPVAFTLAGVALAFAALGTALGGFDATMMNALPSRLYGVMRNQTLIAVPLFVFMGVILERSRVAENLLDTMAALFGRLRGGLGVSVVLVGMLMAASTGIVGATVVTMGLMSLPTMMRRGYGHSIATGTICASGTLGQIIPPSIILVLLGDQIATAFQKAQLDMGVFSPKTVSVGDMFVGALLPGLLLVALYIVYLMGHAWLRPRAMPAAAASDQRLPMRRLFTALAPPITLMVLVLGSIIAGAATPTEAASVGAVGAVVLALAQRELDVERLTEAVRATLRVTSMVFLILIGASIFSLVFRGFGGDLLVERLLSDLPGGVFGAMLVVMVVMFLLGFILDFIEITFVVVPLVAPVLIKMGVDPLWLGVMIAMNLQASFLTPPFGFALFYLRGVAPAEIDTAEIYRGVVPYIGLQLTALAILALYPPLVTWLPSVIG